VDSDGYDPFGFDIVTTLELDIRVRKEDSVSAITEFKIRSQGEPCFYGTEWCDLDASLICHCTATCLCIMAGTTDDQCGDGRPGCSWGHGCFQGYCKRWFEIFDPLEVDDPWLCASLMVDEVSKCLPSTENSLDIFLPCDSDLDCVSADGRFATKCRCGILSEAYCELHRQDEPWVEYKKALMSLDYYAVAYYRMLIDNWPHL
jgi:hypothetical protein